VISAQFCAAVLNMRIMEMDVDAVPWRDELVDAPPVIENCGRVPDGAWG
jgi:galactonate dehydratase